MPEKKKRAPRQKAAEKFERARVEIENEIVSDVSAREVHIRQGGMRDVKKAETVEISMGGANAIDAKEVAVTLGGVVQSTAVPPDDSAWWCAPFGSGIGRDHSKSSRRVASGNR